MERRQAGVVYAVSLAAETALPGRKTWMRQQVLTEDSR